MATERQFGVKPLQKNVSIQYRVLTLTLKFISFHAKLAFPIDMNGNTINPFRPPHPTQKNKIKMNFNIKM